MNQIRSHYISKINGEDITHKLLEEKGYNKTKAPETFIKKLRMLVLIQNGHFIQCISISNENVYTVMMKKNIPNDQITWYSKDRA